MNPAIIRRVCAKQMALLPDYQKAMAGIAERNAHPMLAFLKHVLSVAYPNDQIPTWAKALSSVRRNAWQLLVRESRDIIGTLEHLKNDPGSAFWPRVQRDLEALAKPLRMLEIMSAATSEEDSFKHGPFRVFTIPGVTRAEADKALAAFDAATSQVRAHFPQVLYGDVYLATTLAKSGPYTPSASYSPHSDTIQLSVRAQRRFDDVYTIIHELGHRYGFKFAEGTPAYREFTALSMRRVWETILFDKKLRSAAAAELAQAAIDRQQGRPFRKLSPEAELWAKQPDVDVKKSISEFLAGKIGEDRLREQLAGHKDVEAMTGKLLHGPLAVTPYGATKVTENFAEAFAHFILRMPMPAEFQVLLQQMG